MAKKTTKPKVKHKKIVKPTKLADPNSSQLSLFMTSKPFAKAYAIFAVFVLVATTIFWSLLGAKVHQGNADQLVDPYLFESGATFAGAQFPGQHSLLIKWPIFWVVKLFGNTQNSFLVATVILSLATVLGFAYIIYCLERRWLVFGTIILALASCLMLVPTQPYAGGILPVNMAMLTTRNIEYVVYIASLVLFIKSARIRSWHFVSGVLLLSLLIASDKLFMTLSLAGAVGAYIVYTIRQRSSIVNMSSGWLLGTILASVNAVIILWVINFSRLTHIVNQSGVSPYGVVKGFKHLVLASVYAVLGILSNFGANPATDTRLLRSLPGQIVDNLLGISGLAYVTNGLLLLIGLIMTFLLVKTTFLVVKKRKAVKQDLNSGIALAICLLFSSLVAVGIFIASDHYYPVDARYLAILGPAIFVAAGSYISSKPWNAKFILGMGAVCMLAIVLAVPAVIAAHDVQQRAISGIAERDKLVAEALRAHPLTTLVGDYWRVLPIKQQTAGKQAVTPLGSCGVAAQALTSQAWNPDLNNKSFGYLLSLDASLTGYKSCSLEQVTQQYGKPNASVVIAGSLEKPKELLLFYDKGTRARSPRSSVISSNKTTATVLPVQPVDLPRDLCSKSTVMNFVAHEDDDLLFLSPDLINDLKADKCVRTVYMTAGDAGSDKLYWLGREEGSQAAYSLMLGSSEIWIKRTVKLAEKQFITVANPRNNSKVSLIFMHLPDGNITGRGFFANKFTSLNKLSTGLDPQLTSVDNESNYTKAQLVEALAKLMKLYEPAVINAQADYTALAAPDHSDHRAVGRFVELAHVDYLAKKAASSAVPSLKFYMGYSDRLLPENVLGPDLAIKTAAFLAYSQHDGAVCHSREECDNRAVYGEYLRRQYLTSN